MTERTSQTGMDCTQFEALLAEALDNLGSLRPEVQREFEAHRLSCGNCGPLWAEVREGMLMLDALEEVEPPKNLVHNILAATSHAQAGAAGTAGAAVRQPVRKGWLAWASVRPVLSSRFAMSFGMAFFSIGLTLSALGVNMKDVGKMVAHPTMLRKTVVLQYTSVEARVQRYYDNLRLVYEVETRVQGLKKAAQPSNDNNGSKPGPQNRSTPPDTSGQPAQHENYSQERDGSLEARSTWKNEGAQI
ncbi:MAG TPA: hypothetical protein VE783_00160 [Candidatus Limnocylindrales bacterium]|nr:hypothetical protein [Candidatus Limnocylindrales bacterium]